MQIKHPRQGYSLIELIVVVAILAILFALALAGVQKVRQASIKLECTNHERQLALSLHLYHQAQGYFPPAVNRIQGEPYRNITWLVYTLPYIDQEAMWRQLETDFLFEPDAYNSINYFIVVPYSHPLKEIPVKLFGCGADWRVSVPWDVYTHAEKPTRLAMTSYVGNAGSVSYANDGILYRNSRVSMAKISDGASNTILFGERPPGHNLRHGWWYTDIGTHSLGPRTRPRGLSCFLAAQEISHTTTADWYSYCGAGPFDYGRAHSGIGDPCAFHTFWSLHGGGANFAFCDGSVRFIRYSLGSGLQALASRNGGEVPPALD